MSDEVADARRNRRFSILAYIQESVEGRGYPPTIQEIRKRLRLRSKMTVHADLVWLEGAGFIKRGPGPREITILKPQQLSDDPRRLGGDIVSTDQGEAIVNTENAVLLNQVDVVLVHPQHGQPEEGPVLAMRLEGRINRQSDRTRVLYIFDEDGAAAIVSQLMTLAYRIGPEFGERLMTRIGEILDGPSEPNTTLRPGDEVLVFRCDKCLFETETVRIHAGQVPDTISCRRGGSIDECDGTARLVELRRPHSQANPQWEWVSPGKGAPASENRAVSFADSVLQLRSRRAS